MTAKVFYNIQIKHTIQNNLKIAILKSTPIGGAMF